MAKTDRKTTNISITLKKETINELDMVCERLHTTRSQIFQEFCELYLPILSEQKPTKILQGAFDLLSKEIKGLGDFIGERDIVKKD